MKAKNINSIFYSKFGLIFKIIIFAVILAIVFSVISFSIISPVSKDLRKDIAKVGIGYKFVNYIDSSLSGQNVDAAREELVEAIKAIDDVLGTWSGELIASIVVFIFFMILYSIVYFMSYYTISDIVHNFMSSNSDYGFAANFVANIKKSFRFSLLYTLYTYIVYIAGFAVSLALGLLIGKLNAIIGLFIMYLLAVGTLALRRALVAFWMPAMISKDLGVRDAFLKNMEMIKSNFGRTFVEYFVLYIVAIILFILSAVVTFGVGMIVVYAGAWLYFQIKDMVDYYHETGMKYYIDEQTVINPKKVYKDAVLDDENFTL